MEQVLASASVWRRLEQRHMQGRPIVRDSPVRGPAVSHRLLRNWQRLLVAISTPVRPSLVGGHRLEHARLMLAGQMHLVQDRKQGPGHNAGPNGVCDAPIGIAPAKYGQRKAQIDYWHAHTFGLACAIENPIDATSREVHIGVVREHHAVKHVVHQFGVHLCIDQGLRRRLLFLSAPSGWLVGRRSAPESLRTCCAHVRRPFNAITAPFFVGLPHQAAHSSISRRRFTNRSLRRYAASVSSLLECASATSATSRG
jgi:hypothetical protein